MTGILRLRGQLTRIDGRFRLSGTSKLALRAGAAPRCMAVRLAAVGWGLAMASPLALAGALKLAGFHDLKSRREEPGWSRSSRATSTTSGAPAGSIPWLY